MYLQVVAQNTGEERKLFGIERLDDEAIVGRLEEEAPALSGASHRFQVRRSK